MVKRRTELGKQVTDSMRVEIGSKMILIQEEPMIAVTPSSSLESGLEDEEEPVKQDESRSVSPNQEILYSRAAWHFPVDNCCKALFDEYTSLSILYRSVIKLTN